MKVIRIYDDRKVLYNNIDWARLCSTEISVEYCTFENRNRLRIVVDESHNINTINDWALDPNNEYYVFLDTLWNSNLMDQSEWILDELEIPRELIHQLAQLCVIKVIVYTTYDSYDAEVLVNALHGNDNLVDKVKNEYLRVFTFQPNKILYDIMQEVE